MGGHDLVLFPCNLRIWQVVVCPWSESEVDMIRWRAIVGWGADGKRVESEGLRGLHGQAELAQR